VKKSLGIFLLIFLFASLLGCGTDHKTLPVNQFVAFLTQITGTNNFQINIMKNDGTGVKAVGTPDTFVSVRLSPDGKKVVFTYYNSTTGWQIGTMNVDGTGRTALTTAAENLYPQFTPDGTKIVYASRTSSDQYVDLFLMNADGTNPTNLTHQVDFSYYLPTVSPDGKTIAVNRWNSTSWELVTMNMDGTGAKVILSGSYLWPSFSSDGKKIFVTSYTNGQNIAVVNVDGTNVTNLTTSNYDWCPIVVDSKVLFESRRDSTTQSWTDMEIYNMNLDGTGITRLTNNTVYDGFIGEGES
jgi:Tol biopolymer transport system component